MLILKSNVSVLDSSNDLEFLENDYAIIRNLTQGLFDSSHAYTFSNNNFEGVAIPSGQVINTLTYNGESGAVSTDIDSGLNNGILVLNAGETVSLPLANFKPATDGSVEKGVFISWVKFPDSVSVTDGTAYLLMCGDRANTSISFGRLAANYNISDGNFTLSEIVLMFFGVSILIPDSYSEQLVNQLNQIALSFEKLTDTTYSAELFINGEKILTQEGSFNYKTSSSTDFTVGSAGAYSSSIFNNIQVGRINVADLTGSDINGQAYIQRDYDQALPFFTS